jgi:predicted secreted protein
MVFKFTGAAEGQSQLEMHYKRTFEKDKEPARKYTLTVTVK